MLNETNHKGLAVSLKVIGYWMLFLLFLFIAGAYIVSIFPASWERYVYGIAGTLGAFAAVWILLKMEKRSFADYGLSWQRNTISRFVKGIIIGAAAFGLIILILLSFTDLKLSQNTASWYPVMLLGYLAIIPLALMEEVAFRSFSFVKLNGAYGLRIAQIITAVAFALYHIVQGWNWQIAFLGPGIWAFVFGLSAAWTKGIAMPTGIHVALNLMQTLFGMKEKMKGEVWSIQLPENAPAVAAEQVQTWGIITQALILVIALLLTEFFIRKRTAV